MTGQRKFLVLPVLSSLQMPIPPVSHQKIELRRFWLPALEVSNLAQQEYDLFCPTLQEHSCVCVVAPFG